MRLHLVISSLRSGGAERVASLLANHWCEKGHQVTITTFDEPERKPFYPLHRDIALCQLDLLHPSRSIGERIAGNIARVLKLRKRIRSADSQILISFSDTTNILCLLASAYIPAGVIVTEHTDPRFSEIGKVWRVARRMLYRKADMVVVLNKYIGRYFAWLENVKVIPNPVAQRSDYARPKKTDGTRKIIAVGRFTREKRFDVLIEAFSRLRAKGLTAKLTILGDGPLRSEMEDQISALGLVKDIALPGYVANTDDYYRDSDIFVSASVVEGFPMALTEAMAMGLPVVAVEYHEGINEIIEDGKNGLLVPRDDVEGLATRMAELMEDNAARLRIGEQARFITERFGLAVIQSKWEELFRELRIA